MKPTYIIPVLLFLSVLAGAQTETQLKKIEITASNNHILDKRYIVMPLADRINTSDAIAMRQFAEESGLQKKKKDIDFILEMLRWVSSCWTHDGNNSAEALTSLQILKNAKRGQRYRCVEYGRVMASLLRSYGFLLRTAGLKSLNAPYGEAGSGHFATVVWVNDVDKWIFLDPQNSIYVLYKGEFLNFYEIYMLKQKSKYNEIEFIISKGYTGFLAMGMKSAEEHIRESKDFLSHYFGSMDFLVRISGKDLRMALKLENKNQYLTFQGMEHYGDLVFARDFSDVYFPINQNSIFFRFAPGTGGASKYNELVKNGVIKNMKEQHKVMYLFAPEPRFLLYNDNNMPYFSLYELKVKDSLITMNTGGYFEVNLKQGLNSILCAAINKNDKRGSETIIKIDYSDVNGKN